MPTTNFSLELRKNKFKMPWNPETGDNEFR